MFPTEGQIVRVAGDWDRALKLAGLNPRSKASGPKAGLPPAEVLELCLDEFGALPTVHEIEDPNTLDLELTVNDAPRQKSNTQYLIYNVQRLIEYASAMYTLHPGDVIMTGTPAGVGPVTPGDVVKARVEGLGDLTIRMARS